MVFHRVFFALLCICALLAACGQRESTPTATPIQRQAVTYLANRLQPGFALSIAPDWQYKITDSGLILTNDKDLLAADGGAMRSGALVADVTLLPPSYLENVGARNAAGILDAFVGAPAADASQALYQPVDMVKLPNRDSAQLLARIAGNDTLLLALALEDHYMLAVIVAPAGELESQAAALDKVFASTELRQAN